MSEIAPHLYRHGSSQAQIHELLREDEENSNYGVRRIYQYYHLNKDYRGICNTGLPGLQRENNQIRCKHRPKGLTKRIRHPEGGEPDTAGFLGKGP